MAVLYDAHELLGPQLAKVPLHHREAKLHSIKIWRIWNIEDPPEAVLLHSLLGPLGSVGR